VTLAGRRFPVQKGLPAAKLPHMPDISAISPSIDAVMPLRDGRLLGWSEWGTPDGMPLLRLQGTPGSRLSRHPDPGMWLSLGLRVITVDRPGFGTSTPLKGRGFRAVADDLVELLDQLGLGSVCVYGQSGGAPHALALAALHPTRVKRVAIAVGAAPITADEAGRLLAVNRAGWETAGRGRAAVVTYLQPHRDAMLADPIAGFRAAMVDAPEGDRQILDDPVWQQSFAGALMEALRAGVDGWVDETMAILGDWDFDVARVCCAVQWYHGLHDVNSPISAVRRLIDAIPAAELTIWPESGHMVAFRHERQVLERLIR
jgi:pimeloyl-ACP methyl ester carboxylesterase